MHRSITILFVSLFVCVGAVALSVFAAQETEPAEAAFMGQKKCTKCHIKQYKAWKGSLHAKAFEALDARYHHDAACVKCHTTGFGAGGFTTAAESGHLVGVQCEQCHGAGSGHIALMAQLKKDKVDKKDYPEHKKIVLTPNNCAACHKPHTAHPEVEKK